MNQNEEMIYLLKDIHRMLKEIITYIAYKEYYASSENNDDFLRNILANIISNNTNIKK